MLDKRRVTLINRYQRELDRLLALPPVSQEKYRQEKDYKRAVTLREHKRRRLEKWIRNLSEGKGHWE